MPTPPKKAVLFLSQLHDRSVMNLYQDLVNSVRPHDRVVFLFHHEGGPVPDWLAPLDNYLFSYATLDALGYTRLAKTLVPGSHHHPALRFFKDFPDFDHYWLIEYDVRYTGKWSWFFQRFEDDESDLLGTRIHHYSEQPGWNYWSMNRGDESFPKEKMVRGFFPLFRASQRAMSFLDKEFGSGWCGHSEVLLTTLLHHEGFVITDIGGQGTFTPQHYRNRHFKKTKNDPEGRNVDGSFRFRPAMLAPGLLPQTLYHPVKPLREVTAYWGKKFRQWQKTTRRRRTLQLRELRTAVSTHLPRGAKRLLKLLRKNS